MVHIRAELLETPLDAVAAQAEFVTTEGHTGAVTSFTGMVRSENAVIDHLYLDWYPGMTEASIRAIADVAAGRFDITALTVLHRCGKVRAGEAIVFVAAASAHRRAAFEATDYVMDRLKSEAAFWKREVGEGVDRWVEPRQVDREDLQRWEAK